MTKHKSNEKVKAQQKFLAGGDGGKGMIKTGIEFIEQIDEQIKMLRAQQKEKKNELKEQGVPTSALNDVLRYRKLEPEIARARFEDMAIIFDACGMQYSLFEKIGVSNEGKPKMPTIAAAKAEAGPGVH